MSPPTVTLRRFLRYSGGAWVRIRDAEPSAAARAFWARWRDEDGEAEVSMGVRWYRYLGGRGWRFEHAESGTGRIIVEGVDKSSPFAASPAGDGAPGFVLRTRGAPISAHTALEDFGAAMGEASSRFDVPIPTIFAMMAIEARRQRRDRSHFDPRSLREEPGFVSDERTPHRVSPGLMQTLISTAREANRWGKIYRDLDGELELLTREDLFVPSRSIMLGTAHMRREINNVEDDEKRAGFFAHDPIALCAAYNAGSVREGDGAYNLRTFGGDGRIEKFVAYHNDMVVYLSSIT